MYKIPKIICGDYAISPQLYPNFHSRDGPSKRYASVNSKNKIYPLSLCC